METPALRENRLDCGRRKSWLLHPDKITVMCLIIFAHEPNLRRRLVIAANRDEFYGRPTAPASFWGDAPELLAGRDLRRGGTWMGVTKSGRIAAVTNFRDPEDTKKRPKSRGFLVIDFLKSVTPPSEYVEGLRGDDYDGFNLLAGDGEELWWYSNRGESPRRLSPGVYGLSNHLLDTPWPKVERGKARLRELLADGAEISPEEILPMLADTSPADDRNLPDTGVGKETERMLSAPFIRMKEYGTRSSTVLLVENSGDATFVERRFRPGDESHDDSRFEFRIGT